MNKRPLRWKCQSCNLINSELLEAPNPFDNRSHYLWMSGDVRMLIILCLYAMSQGAEKIALPAG